MCYVINTHVHPDHIFGNAAFASDAPVCVGHDRLPAAMAARGRNYVHALERDLGEQAAGSEVLPPTLTVRGTLELDLGDRGVVVGEHRSGKQGKQRNETQAKTHRWSS